MRRSARVTLLMRRLMVLTSLPLLLILGSAPAFQSVRSASAKYYDARSPEWRRILNKKIRACGQTHNLLVVSPTNNRASKRRVGRLTLTYFDRSSDGSVRGRADLHVA